MASIHRWYQNHIRSIVDGLCHNPMQYNDNPIGSMVISMYCISSMNGMDWTERLHSDVL